MPKAHVQTLPVSMGIREIIREEPVVSVAKQSYNSTVKVQSLFPAHITYEGAISGQLYVWAKAGDIVSVQEQDVADLLSKRIGAGSCCNGSREGNVIFQIVD
jgi:hypothetical protein